MTTLHPPAPATPDDLATRPVRLAIVGTGGMGSHHALGIKDDPDVEITWAVDLDLDRANKLSAATGARVTAPTSTRHWPILASTPS